MVVVVVCSDSGNVAAGQPGMTGLIVESREKRFLGLALLLNKGPLLSKDACCALSLLSVPCSVTALFHQLNCLLQE